MAFVIDDNRTSDSPFVEKIWHMQSDSADAFISQAATHWEMVIMKYEGKTSLTVRGPETKATPVAILPDAEWLGITFTLGSFMPDLPPSTLLDGSNVELPQATCGSFWLHGSTWELPTYDNADAFVERLIREELLAYDPVVDAVLQGQTPAFSPRTLQYRFVRATGLTQNKLHQIQRAKRAAALLSAGMPIADTAQEVGYFDQSHLTNALKQLLGQTPAQIARVADGE